MLGIISRSPTDVQPVLDAIVESAARVCGIDDVVLRLLEENTIWFWERILVLYPLPASRSVSMNHTIRWIREHGTLHVPDVHAQDDFPMLGSSAGWRTLLVAPLRQRGELVGKLNARRKEARPFTGAQSSFLRRSPTKR